MIMQTSVHEIQAQLKGGTEGNRPLSKEQSITCLTIYQILFLAGRVKQLATFWFTSSAGLHCNFYRVLTKEGIIKGITQ